MAITPDDADLEDLFEDLAENISKPGATNIEITETVNPDFVITSMQLDVNLKNVCPRKRVALAIALSEVDQQGNEYQRGTKTLTIPAHFSTSCRDVLVKCVKFILPEDLDVSGGSTTAMCNTRNFKARVFAHNIDSDFYCCDRVGVRARGGFPVREHDHDLGVRRVRVEQRVFFRESVRVVCKAACRKASTAAFSSSTEVMSWVS